MQSSLRLTHSIVQSECYHFHSNNCNITFFFLLVLKPEKREKPSNTLLIAVAKYIFLIKKVLSSAHAMYRKLWLNIQDFNIITFFNQSKSYF